MIGVLVSVLVTFTAVRYSDIFAFVKTLDSFDLAISVQMLFNVFMIFSFFFVMCEHRRTTLILLGRIASLEQRANPSSSPPAVDALTLVKLQTAASTLVTSTNDMFTLLMSTLEALQLPESALHCCFQCSRS